MIHGNARMTLERSLPMAIKTREKQREEEEKPVIISTINQSKVLENVFVQLGKPRDLCKVCGTLTRATPISQTSFRVQIYREMPIATLTDSFFVHVNGDGKILRSDPAISRKY
jgi:hypothetical protein